MTAVLQGCHSLRYRCRHCRTLLRRDPEEIGARCPRCREPLFERANGPEQIADGVGA
jgi:hypothetical protein